MEIDIILVGLVSILFAGFFASYVMKQKSGNEKMISIAKAIKEGSDAFLSRQYKTIAVFTLVIGAILYFFMGYAVSISFFVGAILSALSGYIGMKIAINANVKCAEASKQGLQKALDVAFRGGAVNGLSIVGLGLIGVTGLFILLDYNITAIAGMAFGASLVSLFARVGGGIYTKAADVGADLVGKIEKGIPEDDPRNPAVIADNVGDNVGDCAGMGADLFESYVVTIIAAMLLASSENILLPLTISAVGVIASIIGIFFARISNKNVLGALNKSMFVSAIIATIGFYLISPSMSLFYSVLIGMATAIIISYVTDYYTSTSRKPVQEISMSSETGAATNIISGLSVGMESTIIPVITLVAAIALSYSVGGLFGVAMAAVGLLSLTGIIMTIDTFGPISDNAGGIAEMSKMPAKVRNVTDQLDAVGNTTKATTKGIAIGSAALSALVLLAAFVAEVGIMSVDITKSTVLIGLILGGAVPFLFSSFLMKSVGNAAHLIVKEVRRQFKQIKGLMKGKAEPDYKKVVDISTQAALKELTKPALLAIISPILIMNLGPEALGAFLTGSVVSGLMLALMLANSGAAWDNAKKYIESGKLGGKGSDAHKAAVVGDTVGDPSKDTVAPAINSLIKVMNTLAIIIAPLIAATVI